MSNGNGSRFVDPSAESAVVGTIPTGLFDRIPENKLIPPKAFHDERWRMHLRRRSIPFSGESGQIIVINH